MAKEMANPAQLKAMAALVSKGLWTAAIDAARTRRRRSH